MVAGVVQDLIHRVGTAQRHRFGAQLFRQPKILQHLLSVRRSEPGCGRRLHVHGDPGALQAGRHPPGRPHQPSRKRAGTDADEQALSGRPGLCSGLGPAIVFHLQVDPLRGTAEGQFSQRVQVAFAEEVLDRSCRLVGQVNLALLEPLDEIVR